MALSASNVTILDGAAASKTMRAYTDGGAISMAQALVDSAGALVDPASSAKQDTANTALSAIASNTGAAAITLTASPTVAGTTHAANDVVGSKITLSGAARANSGAGIIQSVAVNITDNVTAAYDVFFFDTDPSGSTFTDDATLNLVAADLVNCCGVAQCTTIIDCGTRKMAVATGLAIPYKISAANTNLYAVIVARGSAAYTTANGVSLRASVLQA